MKKNNYRASNNPIYGMGFIGAIIYFISTATTFWMGALGILKAFIWPVILVYHFLKSFNA